MFHSLKLIKLSNKTGPKHKKVIVLKCDNCNCIFEKSGFKKSVINAIAHYCSHACANIAQKKGNSIDQRRVSTIRTRYGVDYVSQSEICKKKYKETCLKKYACDHAMKSDIAKMHLLQTNMKKYGLTSTLKLKHVRAAFKKKYGVDNPGQLESHKNIDWKEAWKKQHETKKRNKSYNCSKVEDVFYAELCKTFMGVDRQVLLNGWDIDFYVKDINVYIQFDGVYWHGLDRHIDLIEKSAKPRDIQILKTYIKDREQDTWCLENHIALIRITDKQFKTEKDYVQNLKSI